MKKITLTVAALAMSVTAFSQEKAIKQTGFWDNWFIQAQAGANLTVSEGFKEASVFSDLVSPHAAISVGKYFSPVAGARIQAGGWESKNYLEFNDSHYKVQYLQANLDGLVNLTNLFCGYNPDRLFSFVGILGAGYVHGFKDSKAFTGPAGNVALPTTHSIAPRAGFQLDFKTSDAVSLNLEAVGNVLGDDFNGIEQSRKYDGLVDVMAGVTYRFGNPGFEAASLDLSELDRLNALINEQKGTLNAKDSQLGSKTREIADLKDALSKKPTTITTKDIVEIEETVMNAVVVFKLGRAELQDNQEINISNAAEFFKSNPSKNVVVTGYADKSTGTVGGNQKISEKRAETVANILVNKYGIDRSRITTKASGDKEQPFAKDEWNRVVTFTAVNK